MDTGLNETLWNFPPQFWTIIWGTFFTIIFLIWIKIKISKTSNDKAPTGIVLILEGYVEGFENLILSVTGGKLKNVVPYLFSLFNYILIMSLMSLFGFVAAPTSWMFTFVLGFITFIGIYVVGIGTKGLLNFGKDKYANPVEIFSQIAPLLSVSIRLFGATFSAAILGEILYLLLALVLDPSNGLYIWWPSLSGLWSWTWTIADTFFSAIQAFVFVMLTAAYWSLEYGPSWKRHERKEFYKHEKDEKQLQKNLKKKEKQKNFARH